MGNPKLEILLLTNPNTFCKRKCETWVMNLIYGGVKKISPNTTINFLFWHSNEKLKSNFSEDTISSIIKDTSKKYSLEILFNFANPMTDGYSSGIQFEMVNKFIDEMDDNSELLFISDNFFCVDRNVLLKMYNDYTLSNLPFYTQIPIIEGQTNFLDSDMHLFYYHKSKMKPYISEISKRLDLESNKFSLSFTNYRNLYDWNKTSGNFTFSEIYDISKLKDFTIPFNEPGVLFSNIFWCYLFYTNQYTDVVKSLSQDRQYNGGTDNLNGYHFFRRNYTSTTELNVKMKKVNYNLENYILLFECLLHRVYSDSIVNDDIIKIDEFSELLHQFDWWHGEILL
tara:strand:- start:470 stop:1489 length:1020 start_codon:yes stop_codon:yes gene_type:complete